MLETLLTATLAYDQLVDNTYEKRLIFPEDIAVIEAESDLKQKNYLQKKVKNKLSQKSKTGGFIQVLFFNKFKKFLVGEAYEMQTLKENSRLLDKPDWKIARHDFEYLDDLVTLSHNEKNTIALEDFRNYLDQNQDKIPGVIGLLNRYSQKRSYLAKRKDVMPQSDICYLGPKETFILYNNSSQPRPVAEIFIEKFGQYDNSELRLLRKWIAMDAIIPEYENYYYEDYSVECNLGQNGSLQQSWLSLFFYRKNSINTKSWNVTPVSYSPLSKELVTQSKLSSHLYQSLEAFAYEQQISFKNNKKENLNTTVKEILAQKRNEFVFDDQFYFSK